MSFRQEINFEEVNVLNVEVTNKKELTESSGSVDLIRLGCVNDSFIHLDADDCVFNPFEEMDSFKINSLAPSKRLVNCCNYSDHSLL